MVDVPETTSWYPIGEHILIRPHRRQQHPADTAGHVVASNGIVENILIYAPLGRTTRCAFLKPEPSRQTLGAWTVTQALLVALNPPAEVGFVQCD